MKTIKKQHIPFVSTQKTHHKYLCFWIVINKILQVFFIFMIEKSEETCFTKRNGENAKARRVPETSRKNARRLDKGL